MRLTLYSIINKDTKKRFNGFIHMGRRCGEPIWTDKGCFFRLIETVQQHILNLAHERDISKGEWIGRHWYIGYTAKSRKRCRGKLIRGLLNKLVVEVLEVTSSRPPKRIMAREFLGDEK